MAQEQVYCIKKVLTDLEISVDYLVHAPVKTSQEASQVRGCKLEEGIKAILFTNGDNQWIIVDVPAQQKIDTEKVKQELQWSKIRMATPSELVEQSGCEPGSVPPFCHKNAIPILVDSGVFAQKNNAFNIGLTTHSLKIKTEDVKKVFLKLGAKEGKYAV